MSKFIEIVDLCAWFGEFQALYNISLEVTRNTVYALIGPSGCGKSTFIRCLNRLHEEIEYSRASGRVMVEGRNIYEKNIDPILIRKMIGMVFQKPNPFPHLSVLENVVIGLKLSGLKRKSLLLEIAEKSLKSVALWEEVKDKLNKPGTSLSGGQQQRLCIARLLAVEPDILLMDEPCSALDPIATEHIEELMRALVKRYTIVIVTHNMQQAARVSSSVAYFYLGELIEVGPTEMIFTRPRRKETEDYITGRFG